MKKYSFIIDIGKCENCNNCFLSCKDEHCGNEWPGYTCSQPLHGQRWMNIRRRERGHFPDIDVAYLPTPCMHCDNAPCMKAAPDGAVYKRDDGIVIIDPVKAKGLEKIVKSCPFGAIWWNEEENIPQKCTMCAHLLDKGWKKPRCVQACPTGALSMLYTEEEKLQKIVIRDRLLPLDAGGSLAKPRCFYKNLHRYTSCFIAGTIAAGDEKYSECVEGMNIKLLQNDALVAEQLSDEFGDYKFDKLLPGSGKYVLEVILERGHKKRIDIELQKSLSLATIWVEKEFCGL